MKITMAQILPSTLLSLALLSGSANAATEPAARAALTAEESQPTLGMMPIDSLLMGRQDSTSTSLQCSTEKLTQTTICPTAAEGATTTESCTTATVATSVCAEGNICSLDGAGNHICMLRNDTFSPDMIAVTVFLALCFAAGIGTIIWLCVRDHREDRRRKAAAEAAAIAKENKLSAASQVDTPAPKPGRRNVSAAGAPQNPFAG